MEKGLRKTGIDLIGNASWGTHFCQFYQTPEDLIDILVPYFKAGLENNEFCMWITAEPLNAKKAKASLKKIVRDLDDYIEKGQIEILDFSQWYTKSGKFDADEVLDSWVEKEKQALELG
ncbi:MAG: MEDS domain-containing protein [Pseudomonadota bacterium]